MPSIRPAAPIPHTHPGGLFTTFLRLNRNPITAFARPAYELALISLDRGRYPSLMVNEPACIEQVLVTNAANYRKSAQQQRRLLPALGEGLLTAEGETWRAARRLAAPLFTPRAINLLYDDMQTAATAMAQRWRTRTTPAQPLNLAAELQHFTYEIVSKTIFSGALDENRLQMHENLALYFETLGRVDLGSIFNLPDWLPSLAQRRARPALAIFRAIAERAVRARAAAPSTKGDLLDRLLQGDAASTARIADNIITFLAAGHETTANALAWIFYLLALFPDTNEQVVAEITAGGTDLPFTRAMVNESLRLYPPAPFVGREAIGEDLVGGHKVTAGMQIIMSPWILHRHRLLWENPDDFIPERFLVRPEDSLPRGQFIPFGLGPRLCIGQGFAMQEILITLRTILPAFTMRLVKPAAVAPQARITLYPRGGLPMVISERR